MGGEALAHRMLEDGSHALLWYACLASSLCQLWPLPDRPLGGIFSHALITSCLDRILSCGNQAGTQSSSFLTLLWPYVFFVCLFLFYFLGSETSSSKLSSASFPMGLEVTARPSLIGNMRIFRLLLRQSLSEILLSTPLSSFPCLLSLLSPLLRHHTAPPLSLANVDIGNRQTCCCGEVT